MSKARIKQRRPVEVSCVVQRVLEGVSAAPPNEFFSTLAACLAESWRATWVSMELECADGSSTSMGSLSLEPPTGTRLVTKGDHRPSTESLRLRLPGVGDERWLRVTWTAAEPDMQEATRSMTPLLGLIAIELQRRDLEAQLRAREDALVAAEQERGQLRSENRQLQMVHEGTRLGLWDWSPTTNVVTFDARWAEMLGYDLDEIEPTLASWETRVHPDDIAACRAALHEHVEGRTPYYESVHRMRHRAGHWVHILDRGIIMSRSPDGTPLRFCGTHTDISVQKEAERAAVEAMLAKSRFLANMSHELRTPLTAVLGLSGALLEGTYGQLAPQQHLLLETIEESGRYLLDLINDALDLTRIDSDALTLTVSSFSLRATIEGTLKMMRAVLETKRQMLTTVLDPATDTVRGDPRRLRQILANLLVNASKFSPPGSAIRVESHLDPERGILTLAVTDRGVGVSPEDHERIFEPFVMLDDGPSRAQPGVGLGLPLVKRLVALHGGSVHVRSDLGQGATFRVELPWSPSDTVDLTPAGRRWAVAPAALSRNHVLLVEDSEVVVMTVQSYLVEHGFRVTVASDGAQGIRLGCDPSVDVVLMDVSLPRVDGMTAMRSLRERRPDLPIIALTARVDPSDEATALAAGADVFLRKPVNLGELTDAILVITDQAGDNDG